VAQHNESTYIVKTYNRPPVVFTHGKGCVVYDTDGSRPRVRCTRCNCVLRSTPARADADKAYLDFTAGIAVNALGHSDAGWQAALTEQAGKLCHVSNLYLTEPGASLAKTLVETSFADRVFFCNSGTEANEAAIKFARKWQVWQREHGFHCARGCQVAESPTVCASLDLCVPCAAHQVREGAGGQAHPLPLVQARFQVRCFRGRLPRPHHGRAGAHVEGTPPQR
jgi:hypothetical protein